MLSWHSATLTLVRENICGWSTEPSSKSAPSLECLVMTWSQICREVLGGTQWTAWLAQKHHISTVHVWQYVCITYSVSLKSLCSLSPTSRWSGSGGRGLLGHMGSLSSQWRGLHHVRNNSGTIMSERIRAHKHIIWFQDHFSKFYLELVLSVYVPYWRVWVEGGMWVVPAHHTEAQRRQHITGLSLRHWVHLTL